ncbi:MAG TPA: pilus assembly protein TadG-related protein [Bryobacteraceae bacterium]|nr:pilus assembly protein TadG-related protein [Bryobacteraceae bacterium]
MKPGKELRLGSRRGSAALLATLSLTVMFGALGFVVDLGYAQYRKRVAQSAADAAALAAASWAAANGSSCSSGITCNSLTNCSIPDSVTTPLGAACVYAQANGYTQGGSGGQTVTFLANDTNSPVSGNAQTLWFQVTVGQSISATFARFGGISALNVKAAAVAGVGSTGGASCIVALSQAAGNAFTDSGSGNITTTSCGIYDNAGFSYSGSGNITATTIQYAGTYSKTGSGTLRPTPTRVTSYVSDPFANVPSIPVSSTCDYSNYSISDASAHILSPGVYCGGLSLTGSGSITFQTGTYIINGTGGGSKSFNYTGSGNLTGTNVTFYITGQNGYTAGPIAISGSGNLNFSAPSSGSDRGLLFYQDRNVSYAAANSYTGSGNVSGSFYFKTTSLTYSGSGNAAYQAIVANKVTLTGSGNFTKDTTGQFTGMVQSLVSMIQ